MADTIGRAVYETLLDRSGLKKGLDDAKQDVVASGAQAEQAATASANRSVSKFGQMSKAGVVAVAGAAATMFAIAAKGAIELEEATSKYRAETGATADEAKRAGQAIADMSRGNLQNIATIGEVLTKVRTDLGLTGEAGEAAALGILKFSTATGTDAAQNVSRFDDILDGYGLTADKIPGIMDQLVASHQRFGGSLEENQQALGKMAPQLTALGLGLDDGIGLLNLFADSGLDAEAAQKALNAAVLNMPPGTSFEDIVNELLAIEDPADRVTRAVEIFGSKAGVGLANAIKPGMTSMADLIITADEAAGATQDAATAIEGTFGNRIQLLLNNFKGALAGVGSEFGPLVMGMGSIGSLAVPFAGKLAGITTTLWAQVAALAAASGGWRAMLLSMGPFALGAAAVAGGLIAIDQGLNIAAEKLRAFSAGVRELDDAERESLRTHEVFGMQIGTITDHFANFLAIVAPWHQAATDAANASNLLNDRFGAFTHAADDARESQSQVGAGAIGMADAVLAAAGIVRTASGDMAEAVGAAGAESVEEFRARMIELHQVAAWAGASTPGEFSQGLRSAFDNVRTAFTDLKDLMRNTLSPAAQEAELIGIVTSKRLAKGLADTRPEVRAEAQDIALQTLAQLNRLAPGSEAVGTLSMQLLASATEAEKPAIRDAIQAIVGVVTTNVQGLPEIASGAGHDTGDALARGLRNAKRNVSNAADELAGIIRGHLELASPAKEGPWSQRGGPMAWAHRAGMGIGAALAAGLDAGVPDVAGAAVALALAGTPGLGSSFTPALLSLPGMVGSVPTLGGPQPSRMPDLGGSFGFGSPPATTQPVPNVINLNIGTLIADDAGLAELDRRLEYARGFGERTRMPLAGAF